MLAVLILVMSDPIYGLPTEPDIGAFVQRVYGGRIEFDVFRNGKPVGEHVTTFTVDGKIVRVESKMRLTVTVLFIPVYRFSYSAQSQWIEGQLDSIEAQVVDGSKERSTAAFRRGDALEVTHAGERRSAALDLLPTEHWNPLVLERRAVLNTITGRVNAIQIQACAQDVASIAAAAPQARCYEYTGDLNIRVWYDPQGRWAGLAFRGDDDSEITYVARTGPA